MEYEMTFQANHLKEFQATLPPCGQAVSDPKSKNVSRKWAAGTGLGAALPNSGIDRADLLSLAADEQTPTDVVCWSILAWGGMQGNHRDLLHGSSDPSWKDLAKKIRQGKLSRSAAYDVFSDLRTQGKLPGLGPAYFTKLIYFLMPRAEGALPVGYIMDQWVSCSINLLANRRVVFMDSSHAWSIKRGQRVRSANYIVSHVNTGAEYEDYCTQIETLAAHIGRSADETELLLMSKGNPNMQPWRKYVIEYGQSHDE